MVGTGAAALSLTAAPTASFSPAENLMFDRVAFGEFLVGEGLSKKTIGLYLRHVERAQEWLSRAGFNVMTAPPSMIAAWADTLANTQATKGHAATALKYYWIYAGRPQPPLRAIRVPPAKPMVCKAASPEQASTLRQTATGWWQEGGAVFMGLYLALRCEEIATAEWRRFDTAMQWYECQGKFGKTRTLPVHPRLRAELEPHRQIKGWVFPGRKNVRDHVAPATIWTWTKHVAAVAGLGDFHTHQLRHTSLAHALDGLGDLRAVMAFAGHASPEMTAGYTRTTSAKLLAVSAALDF